MNEEEKKAAAEKAALLNEVTSQVKSLIAESQKETVTEKALNEKIEAINKNIAEKLDNAGMLALKENVDKLLVATSENAATIKALNEKKVEQKEASPKSFKESLRSAIMEKADTVLTEKNDDNGKRLSMKDYFEAGNKTTPAFTIKAAVDMLQSAIVGANVATVRLTDLDPSRVGIPVAIFPYVMEWMPSRSITKPTMSVLVVYSYEDGAGTKTEGSAPNKSSFLFKTVEFKAFNIATYFTLSDETLDDLEEAMDEISIVAPDKINDEIDSQILGAAGDDATALAGILTANKHTAFVPATYAAQVDGANIVDVIAKMKISATTGKYVPDTVVMNYDTIDDIAALKDQMDNSIADRRLRFDAMGNLVAVAGMIVRPSTNLANNAAIVMQGTQALIGKRKDLSMKIGYNGTDLTEGQQTVVIGARVAFAVRDKAAVIYSSDLATAAGVINVAV